MMRIVILFFFLTLNNILVAQDTLLLKKLDSKYFEDQFYAGFTYNILTNKPSGVSQNSLSYGLQFGFIKDIPVNTRRNIAFGLGLGYAASSYYHNLRAIKSSSDISYIIMTDSEFNNNKFEIHAVELPIEFRWRTSTAAVYKFWRIYSGLKLSYNFVTAYKFEDIDGVIKFNNTDFRNFNYALTLSVGYNTWNFHVNYSLVPFLKGEINTVNGEPIKMYPLKVGLIFYIL